MQTIMLQTTVLLFASIVSLHIVCLHGLPRLNYVQTFDQVTDIEEFTTLPGVNVVYYYQKGIKRLHPFLKAYNDSASHLQAYNIHLAMVDCTKKGVLLLDKCQEEHNRKEISIYKNGKLLLAVPRTNMFDVESIMSNALQVMLLKEVPLVQTQEELIALEQKMKGKHHLIFSYQHAIGTAEHRVLMEVAYTYQELCKFGLTTLQSTVAALPGYHESDTTAIWLFKCLDNTDDTKSCAVEKYGGNFDLISVMEFVQTLDVDLVQDAGDSGDADPYIDVGLHVVILLYDDSSHSDVKVIGEQIVHRFYGILGVVLVHKNHKLAVSSLEKFAEIKKIPQLIIILRGENGIFYDGILSTDDQTLTKIYRFVHIVLKPVMEKEEIERTGHYMSDGVPELLNYASSPDEQESLLWSVEEQDDPVALHVMELKLKKKIHLDKVLALTDKTFPVETQQEFTVVVFYVTFDDRSMAFLYSYIQAALSLAEQNITSLRRVDCFDWTDVCSKHNITRYPTVQFFRKGHAPWQYNTTLDMNTLVNTVKLFLSGSPIHLQSTSEVREFSEGKIPSDSVSSISVLGIINNEQTQELSLLKSLAEKYVGRYMFGYADEDSAHEIISSMSVTAPGVVVYKHTDIYEPHTIHSGAFTEDDLTQFVQNAAHSTFPELTIYNFPALHKQQKPILLLFLIDEEIKTSETYNLIGQIALAADKSINFAWLNASDTKSIGYRVMNTYYDGIREGSALTVLNHRKGIIYNFDVTSGFTHDDITLWLQNIQDENVLPTKSLNNDEWKPVNPGYDFLAMMDNEEYRQKNPKRCLNNSCRTKPPESQVRTEPLEAEDKHEQQYTHTEL